MNEAPFINGMSVKKPGERAPSYIIANLSIKRDELITFLQAQEGEWINAQIKESKQGKWYIALDSWKPGETTKGAPRSETMQSEASQQATEPVTDEDIIEYPSDEEINPDDIPF